MSTDKKNREIKVKDTELSELRKTLFEITDEIKVTEKEKKKLFKDKNRADDIALHRLHKLRIAKGKEKRLRDTLEDDRLPKKHTGISGNFSQRVIQWEAEVGRHGGARRWLIWIVQLICELLVDGAPPSSIPGIIRTTYSTYNKKEPNNLPSVNFVRQCRVIVQIIGETLAAIKLARVEEWSQMFTDSTTRRQISFQNLII